VKFIVDAQLPKSLSVFLIEKGYDCIHSIDLPSGNKTTDKEILRISKEEGRIVITKDIDFLNSFLIQSAPEKLILVTAGNISNKKLLELFNLNLVFILHRISISNYVEVSDQEITEH
jgi:predicted nuclease of predicted toxin-antitoxin system